jgi:hypothetical protein
VGNIILKSTTGVRVHDGVLSESTLLLGLLLGLCLLGLCHGRNLYVIHDRSLWVIVLSRWCRLGYRC